MQTIMTFGAVAMVALAMVQAPQREPQAPGVAPFTPRQHDAALSTLKAAAKTLPDAVADYSTTRFRNVQAHYEDDNNSVRLCGEIEAVGSNGVDPGWKAFVVMQDGRVIVMDETRTAPMDTLNFILNLVCDGKTAVIDTKDYAQDLAFKP